MKLSPLVLQSTTFWSNFQIGLSNLLILVGCSLRHECLSVWFTGYPSYFNQPFRTQQFVECRLRHLFIKLLLKNSNMFAFFSTLSNATTCRLEVKACMPYCLQNKYRWLLWVFRWKTFFSNFQIGISFCKIFITQKQSWNCLKTLYLKYLPYRVIKPKRSALLVSRWKTLSSDFQIALQCCQWVSWC